MTQKSLTKTIQELLLIFCILKKKKCTLLIFQNTTQPVKNKYCINDSKMKKKKAGIILQ